MNDRLLMFIRNPLWIIIFLNNRGIHLLNDKNYLKLMYRLHFGKKLDLNNPITYNEKLQWLKLYDRKNIYTDMVDKIKAKEIAGKIIGEEYIIPTIATYDNFDQIDFGNLPNKFVIKTNHYGGNNGVFVVNDKKNFEVNYAKKIIDKIMKKSLYWSGREWPYKNVKPKIIVEELLEDSHYGEIRDYKFYCFNGKVKLWFICSERGKNVKFTFFDKSGKFLNIRQCGALYDKTVEMPNNLSKMIEFAELLSKDLYHIRIDFYEVNGKLYFGEFTFYDSSGFGAFEPEEWDKKIGDMLVLPIEK